MTRLSPPEVGCGTWTHGYKELKMTIAWVDPNDGRVIHTASDDSAPPRPGAVAISPAPESGKQTWDFVLQEWSSPPPPPTDGDIIDREVQRPFTRQLIRLMAASRGITPAQLVASIKGA